MKIGIVLCCVAVGALAGAQQVIPSKYQAPPPNAQTVIATVNGKPIKASELEPMLWNWYATSALDDLLSYELVRQDAARKGVVVADADVDKAIQQEIKSVQDSQRGSEQDAIEMLRSQGFTRSRLYLRLKTTLLVDKIVSTQFQPQNFVRVATIIVRSQTADAAQVADAIKKSQDAYDKLKAGQAWDTVLASTSTDQRMIASHGELGWRDLSLFPQSVQDEIKTLPVGAFTKPAQTQFGIQIFKVEAHGQDAKAAELDQLKSSYMLAARQKYMADLKANSKVQILLK